MTNKMTSNLSNCQIHVFSVTETDVPLHSTEGIAFTSARVRKTHPVCTRLDLVLWSLEWKAVGPGKLWWVY